MRYFFFSLIFLLISCQNREAIHADYKVLEGETINLSNELKANKLSVILFLSPECPLCQNYAPTIELIQESFSDKNVKFYGVISGEFYSRQEILKYKLHYGLQFPILLDPEINLADYLDAKMTPEVLVIDPNEKVLYQGAIDNWAISLGQKRIKATAHYLKDAIDNSLAGKTIDPSNTNVVGCFIE